ncbi:MAG: hypothetical protein J6X49_08135 [Victivallales bacterium]|nr:hypothetical protein [Victivallales bacterium]
MGKKKKAAKSEAVVVTGGEGPQTFSTALLRGENGCVCLPVKKTEPFDEPTTQEALVVRVLPTGVRHEVVRQLQAEDARRSPAYWVMVVAVLAASLVVVWMHFPREMPVESLSSVLDIKTKNVPATSEYFDLYLLAKDSFDSKQYNKCASDLAEKIPELLEKRTRLGETHDRLLYYFFESVRLGNVDAKTREMAEKTIDEFASRNHDEMKWHIMRIQLRAQEFLDVELLFANLISGVYKKTWKEKLDENITWIDYVRPLVKRVENQISSGDRTDETLENLRQLKYSLARLLTTRWMLEGGEGKSDFPDDYGDAGVQHREEAWRICCEQSNGGDRKRELVEYYGLRRFIAQVLFDQSKRFNYYYWNGEEHFSNAALRDEIKMLKERLEKDEER